MKTACYTSLLCLLLLWAVAPASFAQTQPDTTALYRVETTDGNEYIGHILYQDGERVRMRTERIPEITLLRRDIVRLQPVDGQAMRRGQLWFDNPQATRYFFSPNGYGLKAGEGYYQNVWVLFNQASVGLTDNISVGVGLVPLFLFAGSATPVWIIPKVSFPVVKDRFNVGAGALVGTVIGEESDSGNSFGLAYGLTTFGSRDRNITVGLGYGFAAGEWADTPLITVGGMLRAGSRSYLLTENYFVRTGNNTQVVLSAGGRRIIKRVGLDFGLFAIPIDGELIAIPWLGLTVPFGNR